MNFNFKNTFNYQILIITVVSFIGDNLLFDKPIGCNIALLQTLLLFLALHRITLKKLTLKHVTYLTLSFGLILSNLYEPSFLACLLFYTQLIYLFRNLQFPNNNSMLFFKSYFQHFTRCLPLSSYHNFKVYIKRMSGKSANNIHSSYKTWIVPISISGIFLFLFALANPLIEQYFSWLIKLLEKIELFEAVLFFILFTLSWAVLRKKVKTLKPQQHVEKLLPGFTDAVILKSLTLFNLVFLLENTIDSIFLLSGKELPEGITYAQYAHQGAYPLIITTLIAALFVLIVFNKNRQRSSCNTIYNLLYFWIAQNIFLLFSSALRLVKYIDAYSLTEWRVASLIWLALVAIGFLLITIRIIYNYSNEWLIAYNSKVAYLTLFICCFINFESNIALYNIQESNVAKANNKEFDFYSVYSYDHNLIPAFDWACDNAIHLSKRAYFCSRLNMEIEQNLDKMKEWRRFTISRYVAKTLFTKKTSAISMFKEKHHLIISENNYICNSEHLDYTSMSQIYDIHTLDGQLLAARQFGGNLEYYNRIYQNQGYSNGKFIAKYILSEVAKNHPLYTILANENETELNYTMATALMNIDWPNKSCYYSLCNGSICSAIYEYRN